MKVLLKPLRVPRPVPNLELLRPCQDVIPPVGMYLSEGIDDAFDVLCGRHALNNTNLLITSDRWSICF